jgi:hypothetical protein
VQGISAIHVERNSNNEAALNLAPHVMSFQLVEMALLKWHYRFSSRSISKSIGKDLA